MVPSEKAYEHTRAASACRRVTAHTTYQIGTQAINRVFSEMKGEGRIVERVDQNPDLILLTG
jgi:hypothetical protein